MKKRWLLFPADMPEEKVDAHIDTLKFKPLSKRQFEKNNERRKEIEDRKKLGNTLNTIPLDAPLHT